MTPDASSRPCPACNGKNAALRYTVDNFRVVQCLGCSLTYLQNPPPDGMLYEEYHATEEPDPFFYSVNSSRPELRELYAINSQRVEILKKLVPSGKLLDVGCGRGYFLKLAGKKGYDAEGIDVSDAAVRYAVAKMEVNATRMDARKLARTGVRFDLITAWHVLEHFDDPLEVLRSLRNLLTDRGLCFIEVPNLQSLKFMLAHNKWQGGNHPRYHRTFFTETTLGAMLRKAGFSSVWRVPLSYKVPGRSGVSHRVRSLLNRASLDADLDFAARK